MVKKLLLTKIAGLKSFLRLPVFFLLIGIVFLGEDSTYASNISDHTNGDSGANISTQKLGGDFTLTDQFKKPFSTKTLRGKIVLLFFGYTYCPDVCPTELGNIAKVLRQVKKLGKKNQLRTVFVTVDPERDTPTVLKQYLKYFDPDIIGLTGSVENVHKVTDAYHVVYRLHKAHNGNYIVDHSSNLYVLNRKGKLVTIIPFGFPVEHTLQVLKKLIQEDT